jgi:hypothetical protein
MANIRAQLAIQAQINTLEAEITADTLAKAMADVPADSILKIGNDRSGLAGHIMDMFDAVDHHLNPTALTKDLHCAPTAKHLRVRATANFRLHLLEHQEALIRNESDSILYVALSHTHGTSGEQVMTAPLAIPAWGSGRAR